MSRSDEMLVDDCERRISWVLAHPGMSTWLKQSISTALERDPIDVRNDLEILDATLRHWSEASVAFTRSRNGNY